jgi:YggT family protein
MNTQGALTFLIGYLFDLYIFLVLTRFILQAVRADFYNPISQFVVKATNPPLVPLRRVIPGWKGLDFAALVLVIALLVVKLLVMLWLGGYGTMPTAAQWLLITVRELAGLLLSYVFWAVLIRVILSWVAPDPNNPFTRVVIQITEPVMAPARKALPPMGGLDLSPIIVLLGIQFLRILFQV